MQRESCSILGSKHQHKLLDGVLFNYALRNTSIASLNLFLLFSRLAVMDILSAKSDVNGLKEKVYFFLLCSFDMESDKKKYMYIFFIKTNPILDQTRVYMIKRKTCLDK